MQILDNGVIVEEVSTGDFLKCPHCDRSEHLYLAVGRVKLRFCLKEEHTLVDITMGLADKLSRNLLVSCIIDELRELGQWNNDWHQETVDTMHAEEYWFESRPGIRSGHVQSEN